MSAFHFINATKTTSSSPTRSNLSASLADDFFGDQFTSFVNQTPHTSPTLERRIRYDNNKPINNSSSISISSSSSSSGQHQYDKNNTKTPSSSMKKSAFSFIRASSNIHLLDVDDDAAGKKEDVQKSPKQSMIVHKKKPGNNHEINQLSAETTWKRIQAEKEREKDKIQRCYHKRALIHEQIIQLKKEIRQITLKSKEALSVEDYVQAQAFQTQENKLIEKLWNVFGQTEDQVEQDIHTCWLSLAKLIKREMEAAEKLADCCQHTKDERERQLVKYNMDRERKYEERQAHIHQQRGKLDQEKSEIAFDMEIWEQSDTEFKSQMEELVHEERSKKEEKLEKMKNVQSEIDQLMTRLGELQQVRDTFEEEIHQLDISMHDKMQPYLDEKQALEQDHALVKERQQAMEKRWNQLDQEDEILYREMEQHTKEKENGKKELKHFEEQIQTATQQLEQGEEEHDTLMTTFDDYVESRDTLVANKKQAMIRAHQNVTQGTRSIEAKQRALYTAQVGLEEQQSVVNNYKEKLSGLKRQKALAVSTRQFQLAADVTSEIKSMTTLLDDSEGIRNDRQKKIDESLSLLQKEENELVQLKKECMEIQQTSVTEMLDIFQKSKESMTKLMQLTLEPSLQLLVALECSNLDKRIQSTQQLQLSKDDTIPLVFLDQEEKEDQGQ